MNIRTATSRTAMVMLVTLLLPQTLLARPLESRRMERAKDLIAEERPTVLLVTHDVDEALYLADRVLVFSHRPAVVLKEVELGHIPKTHDLSVFAYERREVLKLLGIDADIDEDTENFQGANL